VTPYSTSGANDTIFMNFSVLNSRVTGPKIEYQLAVS